MAKEIKITKSMEQEYLEESNAYGEEKVDVSTLITSDDLAKIRREPVKRNTILIKTRSITDPNPDLRKYIDLCFYDKKEGKIVGEDRIPLFYRNLYGRHLMGKKNTVLYAEIKHLEQIKKMLANEKKIASKEIEKGQKFLKDIDSILKDKG